MSSPEPVSFRQALGVWAQIAAQSFGGPAGQIAVMHRVLVEEKRWLSEARFLHALNYCMLLPGPEAQQLVTYSGWLMHGYRGGLAAGSLFVLPGFTSILCISVIYVTYADVPSVAAALLGLKAAVLSVVLEAVIRIGRRVLSDPATVAVAIAAFGALFFLHLPFPLIVITAAALGLARPGWFPPPAPPEARVGDGAPPLIDALIDEDRLPHVHPSPRRDLAVAVGLVTLWLAPTVLLLTLLGPNHTFTTVSVFFSKAALVTFGGAYSVLAYVAQQAVEVHGWLQPAEMLDGLGFAETTPGPLIQVVQFVAFLATWRDPGALPPIAAAVLGSILATWVTFLPSFAFVLAGAPYVERVRKVRTLSSALRAITAAVVGVVVNLGVWLAMHVLFSTVYDRPFGPGRLVYPDLTTLDPVAAVIAVIAGILLLRIHVPMTQVLMVSASAGLVAFWIFG